MKRIVFLLLASLNLAAFGQAIPPDFDRTTPVNSVPGNAVYNKRSVVDANLKAKLTLFIPKGATPTLNNAKDSLGAVFFKVNPAQDTSFYVYHGNNNWVRYAKFSDLENYTPIQDGLISGGNATIGVGSVTIDTAYYRLGGDNKTSLDTTFTGIANSPSGTQYYLLVYGKADNTLDTISGARDTIAVMPTRPTNTVSINTVLVGDGGVQSAEPDLSGYALTNGSNAYGTWPISIGGSSLLLGTPSNNLNAEFVSSGGPQFDNLVTILGKHTSGFIFQFNSLAVRNWLDINPPDTTIYRTVANSLPLADTQRKITLTTTGTSGASTLTGSTLNIPQYSGTTYTFSSPLVNTSGVVSIDNAVADGTTKGASTYASNDFDSSSGLISLDYANGQSASASTKGFVTSADWSTFNGKESALTFSAPLIRTGNAITLPIETRYIQNGTGLQATSNFYISGTGRATNFGAGIAPNTNHGFTGAASTSTTTPFLITPGVTYTGTQNGAVWYETTNSRLKIYRGGIADDIVTANNNFLFGGTGVRAITANPAGDIAATTPIIESYNTDTDVITALTAATYTPTANITPANSKVFYKGQLYYSGGSMYFAINDNVALKSDATRTQVSLASGNGSATTISIPHGLSYTPFAIVQAGNTASAGITYTDTDSTNINLYYSVAPANGTNNLRYKILIK